MTHGSQIGSTSRLTVAEADLAPLGGYRGTSAPARGHQPRQIDALVYGLYGLSDKETKLVEG
jgi:hypothetical protein